MIKFRVVMKSLLNDSTRVVAEVDTKMEAYKVVADKSKWLNDRGYKHELKEIFKIQEVTYVTSLN